MCPPSTANALVFTDETDDTPHHHSLAHELAVALMPEPGAGSKLLAEELGIEFDDGANGTDSSVQETLQHPGGAIQQPGLPPSFADELASSSSNSRLYVSNAPHDPHEGHANYTALQVLPKKSIRAEQDAMVVLAQSLGTTDNFLAHLRRLDTDAGVPQLALESLASDVIRRLNDAVREREGQVRELLGCEREFRKIASEINGGEVLAMLDELTEIEGLVDEDVSPRADASRQLDAVEEETDIRSSRHNRSTTNDWELDPNRLHDVDEEEEEVVSSPIKDNFSNPPPIIGPPTPAKTISQLAHFRTCTTSLVSSLTTLSEQAQVNGVATTEAGRKIRALKNKLGGWRMDWDNAERSRVRIERWEAGSDICDEGLSTALPLIPSKRVDGRKFVKEHLRAFEQALADAAVKTQEIMAR